MQEEIRLDEYKYRPIDQELNCTHRSSGTLYAFVHLTHPVSLPHLQFQKNDSLLLNPAVARDLKKAATKSRDV